MGTGSSAAESVIEPTGIRRIAAASGNIMSKRRLAALGGLLCLLATPVAAAPVCTLLVEADSGTVLEQQGAQCETRNSPASTF